MAANAGSLVSVGRTFKTPLVSVVTLRAFFFNIDCASPVQYISNRPTNQPLRGRQVINSRPVLAAHVLKSVEPIR